MKEIVHSAWCIVLSAKKMFAAALVAVASGAPGAMSVAVTVKDGDIPKRVSSEKVAQMFEATTDVADWTEGRIEATVTDRTKDLATPVEFTVTSGDGTAEKAFLRIRK